MVNNEFEKWRPEFGLSATAGNIVLGLLTSTLSADCVIQIYSLLDLCYLLYRSIKIQGNAVAESSCTSLLITVPCVCSANLALQVIVLCL